MLGDRGDLGLSFDPHLDGVRVTNAQARVILLMLDGLWHSRAALTAVGGVEGVRRVRFLRDPEVGAFVVERRRDPMDPTSGAYEYRIAPTSTMGQKAEARAWIKKHGQHGAT